MGYELGGREIRPKEILNILNSPVPIARCDNCGAEFMFSHKNYVPLATWGEIRHGFVLCEACIKKEAWIPMRSFDLLLEEFGICIRDLP